MDFLNRVARGFQSIRADSGGVSQDDAVGGAYGDRFFGGLLGNYAAGMRITPESVKSIGCLNACVRTINNTIGPMPLKVFEKSGASKRLADELPEYNLLALTPNDRQTNIEFRQQLGGHYELWGNAYAEKDMNRRGDIRQLLPMHPGRVTPEILSNGRMRYKYADPLTNMTRVLVQEQVFHLRNWSDDGYIGQNTVAMGRDVFGVALAQQDYVANFFRNDAKPSLYFQQKDASAQKFKSEDDKREFINLWSKGQTGPNRHKVGVAPFGWELKEFGVNPANAQLLESRKFSRIEICSLFGVPPHLVGETEKAATYASVEQFNIMYATQCILPRIVAWEQALQRDILQDSNLSARFSMSALLRGDNASRTAAYAVAFQNGWLCTNDIRLLEDLDPIGPQGDVYFRSSVLIPLDQVVSPDQGTGGAAGESKEQKELEKSTRETNKASLNADVVHNTHVLAALADKSPAAATNALLDLR